MIYAGYESLVRSAWGFGYETATHAVRLMPAALIAALRRLTSGSSA